MARDYDNDSKPSYGAGTVLLEGNLAADVRNIAKDGKDPIAAATIFCNTRKHNGYEGEGLKFSIVVFGSKAEAILEDEENFQKGKRVLFGGQLFEGEEYDDVFQLEIGGNDSFMAPARRWPDNGGGKSSGGGRSSRRRDDDDDDSGRSSRGSGRSSRRRDSDEDESESRSSRSSGRSSSRRRGADDEEASSSRSDRSSRRRSRVTDEGDGED